MAANNAVDVRKGLLMNPTARAHRILRHLASFEAGPVLMARSQLPEPLPGEKWLGIYWNHPHKTDEAVLFSDQRVCVRKFQTWTCVAYSSIRHEQVPQPKEAAEGVLLSAASEDIYLPIRGKRGHQRDAYEVLRYFKRIREDLVKQHNLTQR